MKQSFFEIFLRRPIMTLMLNLAIIVFGFISLQRLPVRELPDADPTTVTVLTVYPGASAEVVESEVTERLEEAVSSAASIKQIISESREQTSLITIDFITGTNEDVAAQEVRDRVARMRGELPEDIDEPVVTKQDATAQPIMWVAFYSDQYDTRDLTKIAEEQVKDRLQTVPGVSQVILGGQKRFAIRLWLDSQRMAARQVTVIDVERALRSQSIELPSGRVAGMDRELTIQTRGELKTIPEFNRLIIRQAGDNIVRLEDIANIEEGVEDTRSIARFNSKPSIGLGIVRQSRANTVEVADGVKKRMEEVRALLPPGIDFQYPYDESIYVERAVTEVFETIFIAFALVVVTIFIFLRNIRSTLIPALTVPVSVMGTFALLNAFGYSINIFTLLALVLAIGIVVDDAIVVLENIYRHIEEGDSPMLAAQKTLREIAFAIISITLSLVAVFLPLAFVGGLTGKLLLEFAVALAGSVTISAVVALTLSPMVSSRWLKPLDQVKHGAVFNWFERRFDNLTNRYSRMLGWTLKHPIFTMSVALGSLVLGGYFYQNLDQEFLPEEDKGRFLALALTPEGSTPAFTDRMVRQMESIAAANPAVESYFTAVALPFNGPGDPTQGFMFVRLKDDPGRPGVRDVVGGPTGIGARFFGEVAGAFAIPIMPKAVDLGISQPFEMVISYPELSDLTATSEAVLGKLRQSGFLAQARSTVEISKPELRVHIDRDRAGSLGVAVADISRTLQIMFGGQDLATVKKDGRQYDVIGQLNKDRRLTPSDLDQIYVPNNRGELVQLANVVTTDTGAGPNRIERYNRQRSVTIQGTPMGVTLGEAMNRAEVILKETLPPGFTYSWRGESQNLRESSGDIWFLLILACIIVYMVLAAQFESLIHPFTVMLALPLAALGAFGLLYALRWVDFAGTMLYGWTHYAPDAPDWAKTVQPWIPRIPSMNLNVFSQVGLVLLLGLVTKNSILLVEFANQQREEGHDALTAMLNAGRIRLRPILMTSLATIAGILPIAIGFGDAAEGRRPLGVVAVGGMITSTLLTLFVIPVIYTLLSRFTSVKKADTEPAAPSIDLPAQSPAV